jgi:hypothetical protein
MRIKLDENLPAALGGVLARLGHAVDTVPDEGLGGHDAAAWGGCLVVVTDRKIRIRRSPAS